MATELLIPGILHDKFEALTRLGKGGMGEVLHVRERSTGRELGLKQLRFSDGNEASLPELFKREFAILSSLDHPNIVKVFELIEMDGGLAYSMEFVPGQLLKDWILAPGLRGQRGNEAEALNILLQLARALYHVHTRGVLHHDIHPHNIMLENSSTGLQVKLLDFGISLLKEQQSRKEIRMGASNYKSPEQYRGETLDYTADIYCFGAIAYEVFTGKQPFDISKFRENMFAAFRAEFVMHALKDVPPIKGLNPRVAEGINLLIALCMEKEPEDRYQSMLEVVETIEDLLPLISP